MLEREIYGYEKYKVTDDGRVKGRWGKWLKGNTQPNGHIQVCLRRDDEPKWFDIGYLVLSTFGLWRPSKDMEVCHKNGDPSDNRSNNLCWKTHKDIIRAGKKPARQCKLTYKDMALIRDMYATGEFTQAELAKGYKVSRPYISRIVNGEV